MSCGPPALWLISSATQMYLYRHDEHAAFAVWVFDRGTPEEWDLHLQHVSMVSAWPRRIGKRTAAVLALADFARPNAARRAELVRITNTPGYDPYLAFIMPSRAARALLTILGWVHKAPQYEIAFHGNSTDALAWLESKRGEELPGLRNMVAELLTEYRRTGADIQ
jgi:hypothetical protein